MPSLKAPLLVDDDLWWQDLVHSPVVSAELEQGSLFSDANLPLHLTPTSHLSLLSFKIPRLVDDDLWWPDFVKWPVEFPASSPPAVLVTDSVQAIPNPEHDLRSRDSETVEHRSSPRPSEAELQITKLEEPFSRPTSTPDLHSTSQSADILLAGDVQAKSTALHIIDAVSPATDNTAFSRSFSSHVRVSIMNRSLDHIHITWYDANGDIKVGKDHKTPLLEESIPPDAIKDIWVEVHVMQRFRLKQGRRIIDDERPFTRHQDFDLAIFFQ